MSSPGGSTPERQRRRRTKESPEPAAAEVSIASVLGNPDLLADILLRVASPTWLVRAALVSKTWLRVASDPAFLDRFRALHPPRVLLLRTSTRVRVYPVPQPPELAAAARLARRTLVNLGRADTCMDHCNGRLLVETRYSRRRRYMLGYAVTSLLPGARKKFLPLPPPPTLDSASHVHGPFCIYCRCFLLGDGNNDVSCLYLRLVCDKDKVKIYAIFSALRSGVWGAPQSAVMELQQEQLESLGCKLLAGEKVYLLTHRCILALDLATATLSTVKLPVGEEHCASLELSRAKQSGLFLICATGFQLRVWHGDGAGQWVLVDTVSVREACAQLNVQAWAPDGENASPVLIVGVGDNAEFVILELVASRIICCMQLSNRAVEKVREGVPREVIRSMRPITMVWPPFLPALPTL